MFLLTLYGLACIVGVTRLASMSGQIIRYGNFVFPVSSIQGIISAINSLCCVILVFIDFRKGSKLAMGIMALNILSALNPIIGSHNLAPLPSVVTSLVSFITVSVIYSFYKRSTLNSLTDFITGLPNRRYYVKYANQQLEAKRNFLLACIEIEDFKNINDVYGIQAGDYILKEIAPKLKSMLEKTKCFLRLPAEFLQCFLMKIIIRKKS